MSVQRMSAKRAIGLMQDRILTIYPALSNPKMRVTYRIVSVCKRRATTEPSALALPGLKRCAILWVAFETSRYDTDSGSLFERSLGNTANGL